MKEQVFESSLTRPAFSWIKLSVFAGILLLALEEETNIPSEIWQGIIMQKTDVFLQGMTEEEILEMIKDE